MADGELGIKNLEAGKESITLIQEACKFIEEARTESGKAYSILTQVTPDMGTNFVKNLDLSLEEIYNFLKATVIPAAEVYFKEEEEVVPSTAEKQKDPGNGGNNTPGGGGPSGGGGYQKPAKEEEKKEEAAPTPEPEPEPEPELVVPSLEELDYTPLEEASLGDVKGITDQLISLSKQENKKLDELLADKEKSDLLKALLLESPNVPEEFKKTIEELDSNVVRLILDYILKGNRPEIFDLNSLNIGILYEYLRQVAEDNGISLEDLLKNPLYTQLLRDTLSGFDEVIELIQGWDALVPEEFQVQLRDFYLGNVSEEFPDQDIYVTRAFVDYLAEECDVSYEELINDATYAETLKEGAIQFGKALTFFNASSFFTDEGMRNNISGLFDGTNYKAFGMDKETVESFKSEIDNLAKENNTTAEELLSNPAYAEKIKEALASSSSAKGVGSIYKNADPTVSQGVAKNLYNSKFEKSKQQEEIDKYCEELEKEKKEAEEAKKKEEAAKEELTPEEKKKQAEEEAKKKAEEESKKAAEAAKKNAEANAKEKNITS